MSANAPVGTVTFLFTDIEGSTRLWEQHPEAMNVALARHDGLLCQVIETHQGRVVKMTGDGCYAVFDTALAAVGAALFAQQTLQAQTWDEIKPQSLRVRMALHTGEAEARAGDYFGPALNRTARLMSVGHGGQILLSASTAELVRDSLPEGATLLDLGEHRLKDLTRPEQIYQLVHPSLTTSFPALKSLDTYPNNLPVQLTTFVGREREIAKAKEILARARLLTLTGSGGTGKTRLALQVAAELLPMYVDGAWFVELSALSDPTLIIQSVANVFDLRPVQGRSLIDLVVDYLRAKRLLLILDNCEHLIEPCARLAEQLLRACPGLRIIASSREGLGISGEVAFRVPSLTLPEVDRPLPEAAGACEAIQLFLERAAAANASFTMNERNTPAVVQIVRRLDGIPLAIELAAARAKVFSPEQIASRLDDRFRLLTGGSRTALPRQQTLRALIDWSYELLTEPERALLRQLSVFTGGWTYEAAEALCPDVDMLELLSQLVNKSLVIVDEKQGADRYRLLETIRQYARDRLMEAGEAPKARDRHLNYFLRLSEEAEPGLLGTKAFDWIDRLDPDDDNIRAAIEWATQERPEDALAMMGNLVFMWAFRAEREETMRRLNNLIERVDALPPATGEPAMRRARVKGKGLIACGILALAHGFYELAEKKMLEAVTIERELNDKFWLAFALGTAGFMLFWREDTPGMRAVMDESMRLFTSIGQRRWAGTQLAIQAALASREGDLVARKEYHAEARRVLRDVNHPFIIPSLISLGMEARLAGDAESARFYFEQSYVNAQRLRSKLLMATARSEMVHLARAMGNLTEALDGYRQMILVWKDLGHLAAVANQLECMAFIARAQDQGARTARLLGAAEALRGVIDVPMRIYERKEYDQEVAALRAQYGEAATDRAWEEGRAMTIDQAINYAVEREEPVAEQSAGDHKGAVQ